MRTKLSSRNKRLIGANIYNAKTDSYEQSDVLINQHNIVAISKNLPTNETDAVIDLSGKFVLPGLIDSHVHICLPTESPNPMVWQSALEGEIALYAAKAAERTLLGGVTTARELGGWNFHEIAVRDAINRGDIIGPRLKCAGRLISITTSTLYTPGMYEIADGPDEVRRAARKQLSVGADLIKVMATGALTSSCFEDPEDVQLGQDELRAAVDVANDKGVHVAAHANGLEGMKNAVRAGVTSIENGVFGDEEVFRMMVDKGVVLAPNLSVLVAILSDEKIGPYLPSHIVERHKANEKRHIHAVQLARDIGVKIAMGTDAGTPGNHHGDNSQEIVRLVKAVGMSPKEAIKASTLTPARLLGMEGEIGTLEPGKYADLIAFDDDPMQDIEHIRQVRFVMKGGQIVRNDFDSSTELTDVAKIRIS